MHALVSSSALGKRWLWRWASFVHVSRMNSQHPLRSEATGPEVQAGQPWFPRNRASGRALVDVGKWDSLEWGSGLSRVGPFSPQGNHCCTGVYPAILTAVPGAGCPFHPGDSAYIDYIPCTSNFLLYLVGKMALLFSTPTTLTISLLGINCSYFGLNQS